MAEVESPILYTIGHSNHPIESFLALLAGAGITALADVRSAPYSRRLPQFGREALRRSLTEAGIAYVFLGDKLGARPADPACYRDGVADYGLIAATPGFAEGIGRLLDGARRHRICVMCAEKEPLDCHRTILVARALRARGARIRHILADGTIEEAEATDRRLLAATGQDTGDLFSLAADPVDLAYASRGQAIAFRGEAEDAP
jgi:uncharacterized protein (DUF488 family)